MSGDEAFPLKSNLMKPYSRNQLTNERRMFNYRISRGRKSVECAFGMLTSKFALLQTPTSLRTDKIDIIAQSMCVLHNFIRMHDGVFSIPKVPNHIQQRHYEADLPRDNKPKNLRTCLCKYFCDFAPIPHQDVYNV
ncbi:hypothetical protein NQ314_009453 [Rhamnusium bicolor]|uniref:DDE Tnp4 domain-containing protein n=1 Tax=Rhamnusium bicolor TaxID=1586634 RepID=A0AAV8Y214_9CUCU|nr:hypothetical protein NQ314_009453 [Rhamnusium bicolor]